MLLTSWVVALFIVLIIVCSFLGYWYLVSTLARSSGLVQEKENAFSILTLCFAVGVFCNLSLIAGLAKGYTSSIQSLLVGIGLLFFFLKRKNLSFRPWLLGLKPFWWLLILPGLYFVVRFWTSGLPLQHSDALYYHLAAPKLWAELGQIRLTQEHPSYALTGIWEVVYGIPQLWLGTKGVGAHLIAQISGQWLHIIVGQILSVLVASKLFEHLVPKSKDYLAVRLFLGWLCTCIPALEWQGGLAKNDYVLLAFSLASVLSLLKREYLLSGLLIGFAYATKTLGAWLGIGLVVLLVTDKVVDSKFQFLRAIKSYLIGAVIAVLPFLLRNFLWTGNPMFPNLDATLGPNWLSHWWADYLKAFGGGLKYDPAMWSWVYSQMLHKLLPKVLFFGGLGAFVVSGIYFKWSKSFLKSQVPRLALVPMLLILFEFAFLMLRPIADGRYAGYVIVLWLVFGASFLLDVFFKNKLQNQKKLSFLLLPLGFLITIPAEQLVKIPKNYLFSDKVKYLREFHAGFDFKEWMHKNTAEEAPLVCMAEKVNFYLDRPFEAASEMRKWEEFLSSFKTGRQFVEGLRERGYRYVHVTPNQILPSQMEPYWKDLMSYLPKAVFRAEGSIIFDLMSLSNE